MEKILIRKISKSFGDKIVLNELNLELNKKEIHALLGINGSGKSTLIKIIAGLESPDYGQIVVQEKDEFKRLNRNEVGFIFNQPIFLSYFSGYEYLEFISKLSGLIGYENKIRDLLSRLNILGDFGIIKDYSSGMQKKISIASILLPEYSFLVLDEPFTHLDGVAILEVCSILEELRMSGVGILITSHQFDTIYTLATHISVLHNSKIEFSLSKNEIASLAIKKYPSKDPLIAMRFYLESKFI